ncbi:MAG: alpha/beta fold hydrolase, partial [Kiritimatiellae bacterium]|nr:alpha/beta fold hydrolase [Kiritimatiellia bacterium]
EQDRAKQGDVFRFWVNDDNDSGDISGAANDIPGSGSNGTDTTVNGCSDVEDFTPLLLDFSKVFPAGTPGSIRARVSWKLKSDAVGAVWSALSAEDAGSFQTEDCGAVFGDGLSQGVTNAAVASLAGGFALPAEFKTLMDRNGGQGVVLVEGRAAGEGVYFIGLIDGAEVLTGKVNMAVSPVEAMYRWMNLRNVCGDASGLESSLSSPTNWPDAECDGRHFVFVHGYSVDVQAARGWASEMFKRLWQAGSQSMFTAVDWYGNESQIWEDIPLVGGESPDYYVNVAHALDTAVNFAVAANGLPGDKVVLAHSLGNVLVSEAAENHLLSYSRYYMLNAALPVEAYSPETLNGEMIEHAWTNVNPRLYSANWHELFENKPDSRKDLRWRGRFVHVQNAVNCYSPTEDVLANATATGWGGIWSVQELFKGTAALHFAPGNCEGGWGFNGDHSNLLGTDLTDFAKTNEWTDAELIVSPMFRRFDDAANLHSTNELVLAQGIASRILGDGIPATSFAAGANPLPLSCGVENINFHDMISDTGKWPRRDEGKILWHHSDLKNFAYYYVYPLFIDIKTRSEQ